MFFDKGLHSGSLSRTLTSKTYDSACQQHDSADHWYLGSIVLGTWYLGSIAQLTSHLVIFAEGANFLQFFSLHLDEVVHPFKKTSSVTPEVSALISNLPQRSSLSEQDTSSVLFLQSSQLRA